MNLPILFEDTSLVVLDKPSGLLVHGSPTSGAEPTVVDFLREQYPHIEDVGEPMKLPGGTLLHRPGIVHRLDKETSGVLVVAKTQEAFSVLKEQFQSRETKKIYNAFVWGEMKQKEGVIDRPIGRSKNDPRKRIATRGATGALREAVTEYTVLEKHGGITFVEARPKTGRTHQIRVHLLAINHPIICDPLYASRRGGALGFTRLALHAKSLTFRTVEGSLVTVESPYPKDFEEAFVQFRALG